MNSEAKFWPILIWAAAGAVSCGIVLSAAGDDVAAKRAAEAMGFVDVAVESSSVFAAWDGCSADDAASHRVRATNARGERVALVVCCGAVLKGCTVSSR